MATYIIFIRDGEVVDLEAMEAYKQTNASRPRDESMSPMVVYGEATALEGGDAPDGTVVLRFPDKAAAKAWYEHPVYQEAIKHRQKAADYRVFMIEGF